MRKWVVVCWAIVVASVYGRPVDFSAPSNHLGAASLEGYVQIWREVDSIDAGQGLSLPLRFSFNSGRDYTSPYLGKGWWLPLLESSAIQIREKMMKVNLLCGKTLYMRRDPVDVTKFQSLDGQWHGSLNADTYTVSRDDGWQLLFRNGQLQQLTTDAHRIFDWNYRNGVVMGIQEEGAAQPLLTVVDDSQGHPEIIQENGRSYQFKLDQRPQVGVVQGQMIVQGFDQALSQWNWPGGKKESYEFAIQGNNPSLTITDRQDKQDSYVWNYQSKKIISEDNWTYKVGDVSQHLALPSIARSNLAGQTEGIAIDTSTGQTTVTKLDGSQMVYFEIQTPGPLYGKIRKVEKIAQGATAVVYQAAYDDAGKLLRKEDAKGFITTFGYDQNGSLISKKILPPNDPEIIANLKIKEAELLKKVADAPNEISKGDALEALGFFYIQEAGDASKATALLPQMKNRLQIFNIKLHSIAGNYSLSDSQKQAGFRELLSDYPEHSNILNVIIKK